MNENPQPQAGGNAQTSDANKFREYWHVALERRWLIIATFTVVVVLGVFYAFKATPIYEAVARLQIDPEVGGALSLREVMSSFGGKDTDYLQTQYRNLQSRSLIEAVISKLHLDKDPRYAALPDPLQAVSGDIEIAPIRLTRLVEIKTRHTDPVVAKEMANTLVEIFLLQNQDRRFKKASDGLKMLKTEADTQEMELTSAIEALQKYRVNKGMISLTDDFRQGENVDSQALRNSRADVDQQTSRTAGMQKLVDEGEKWIKEGREIADFYGVNQDKLVSELKGKITASESQLTQLRARYREKHPQMIALMNGLQTDRERLKIESQRAFDAVLSNLQVESAAETQARVRLKAAEERISTVNEARTKYDVLNRQKEKAEVMYQAILTKLKEYDLNSKDKQQNMVIIDGAIVPLKWVKPNRPLVIAASIVGGLALALGFAFFINFLDDSVKSQEDVENFLHLPFLGYIPNIKTTSVVERDLQAHRHTTSSAAEGFRTLRAAVSLARNSDKLRCLSVTSTIPSEGKSLVASNLAIVTAQTGLRTLLVDADLRRPSVHKAFELQSPIGLAAYLAERVRNLDEIIHTSEVPHLDIVCCGALPTNPSELIGSKRMVQFIEEAAQRYDRIILDCPPISAVADPLVVGAMCDGVVYVTKFNKIRREHALRSVQRVQDAGIHVIGLVLNDIDFEGKDSYYYSYHYYQNRYYSSHYRSRTGADAVGEMGKKGAKETTEPAKKS